MERRALVTAKDSGGGWCPSQFLADKEDEDVEEICTSVCRHGNDTRSFRLWRTKDSAWLWTHRVPFDSTRRLYRRASGCASLSSDPWRPAKGTPLERADCWSLLDGAVHAVYNICEYVRRSILGENAIPCMDTWASPLRHNSTRGNHRQEESVRRRKPT